MVEGQRCFKAAFSVHVFCPSLSAGRGLQAEHFKGQSEIEVVVCKLPLQATLFQQVIDGAALA